MMIILRILSCLFYVRKGYIIDYFGAHFYVDLKSKFATPIYGLKDQRELRKAIQSVGMAPEHSDWKKYVKEIEDNQSLVNISIVIEAAIESSFQFWFQTVYLMPTVFLSFMDLGEESKWSDLVNWRVFSILLSFGTFSWTFCSIE